MKLAGTQLARFLQAPAAEIAAVLIHGSDAGLVAERAEALVATVLGGTTDDPFRLAVLAADAIAKDAARLADEAAAQSLIGGRRVVRVRGATDGVADALAEILDRHGPGGGLILLDSGALEARSKLRRLCESHAAAAAIACYPDGPREIAELVRAMLGRERIAIAEDALHYLAHALGSDRQVTRQEIEKLCLFAGPGGKVTLDDAVASVGDSSLLVMDDLAFDALEGKAAAVESGLDRLFGEGEAPVTILRAMLRQVQRLHLARARVARRESADAVIKSLRPPLFFKLEPRFRGQLERWSPEALARLLSILATAESDCKRTGYPDRTLCRHALLAIASLARGTSGRR